MAIYRLLITMFALWTLAARPDRAARLGFGWPLQAGPHVWLHGASNGELASVRPVLQALIAARPDLRWLVTCNSATGVALVEGWRLDRVEARLAPLDLAWITRSVLRRWQVVAHVPLESELWPHRVRLCPGPVIVLGARMSAGTARTWARLPGLARRVLRGLTLVHAQDADSRARLLALGLPPEAAGPVVDLKAFYTRPDAGPDATLRATFARDRTWLAASTHEGEEAIVLDAHRRALATDPTLRLILAPRHPRGGDAVSRAIADRGLTVSRRSEGTPPGDASVYLADTMGEMAMWYALAGRVFIGGSLAGRGGHTPYEPAAFGCALITGPDMRNFAPAMQRLEQAGVAVVAQDAKTLATALLRLSDPAAQTRLGGAQAQALRQDTDANALSIALASALPRRGNA